MEFPFCLVFVVLLTGLHSTQSEEDREISRLETYFDKKCWDHTRSKETFNKLRNDVFEANAYFGAAFDLLPNNRKVFCSKSMEDLEYRINQISNDLKPCLGREEEFLADFFKESFEEFLHFWCHNEGENIIKFFNKENTICIQDIDKSNSNDLVNCLNRIFPPAKSHFITKSELCDDITVAEKCYKTLVSAYCPRAYNLKDLTGTFFNYVSKPCSGCANAMNLVILSGLLVFHWLLNF